MWSQVYDPFGSLALSTIAAAIPVLVLLGAIGIFEIRAHVAAMLGLAAAILVAVVGFGMPADKAGLVAIFGAGYGLMPIGWIILNVIFLYQLTNEKSAARSATSPTTGGCSSSSSPSPSAPSSRARPASAPRSPSLPRC